MSTRQYSAKQIGTKARLDSRGIVRRLNTYPQGILCTLPVQLCLWSQGGMLDKSRGQLCMCRLYMVCIVQRQWR